MSGDPFLGAREPALRITRRALEPVTQDVKATSMAAVAGGVGHACLSVLMVEEYARRTKTVCCPRCLPPAKHSLKHAARLWGPLSSERARIGFRPLDIRGHTRRTR